MLLGSSICECFVFEIEHISHSLRIGSNLFPGDKDVDTVCFDIHKRKTIGLQNTQPRLASRSVSRAELVNNGVCLSARQHKQEILTNQTGRGALLLNMRDFLCSCVRVWVCVCIIKSPLHANKLYYSIYSMFSNTKTNTHSSLTLHPPTRRVQSGAVICPAAWPRRFAPVGDVNRYARRVMPMATRHTC